MSLLSSLRRGFLGSRVRNTEDVQQHILTLLSGHTTLDSDRLVSLLNLSGPPDAVLREVHQAAQILVNKGAILARQNGHRIDPVAADGPYTLTVIPH